MKTGCCLLTDTAVHVYSPLAPTAVPPGCLRATGWLLGGLCGRGIHYFLFSFVINSAGLLVKFVTFVISCHFFIINKTKSTATTTTTAVSTILPNFGTAQQRDTRMRKIQRQIPKRTHGGFLFLIKCENRIRITVGGNLRGEWVRSPPHRRVNQWLADWMTENALHAQMREYLHATFSVTENNDNSNELTFKFDILMPKGSVLETQKLSGVEIQYNRRR